MHAEVALNGPFPRGPLLLGSMESGLDRHCLERRPLEMVMIDIALHTEEVGVCKFSVHGVTV